MIEPIAAMPRRDPVAGSARDANEIGAGSWGVLADVLLLVAPAWLDGVEVVRVRGKVKQPDAEAAGAGEPGTPGHPSRTTRWSTDCSGYCHLLGVDRAVLVFPAGQLEDKDRRTFELRRPGPVASRVRVDLVEFDTSGKSIAAWRANGMGLVDNLARAGLMVAGTQVESLLDSVG